MTEEIYRYLIDVLPPQQAGVIGGARARLRELLVAEGRHREALPLIEQEIDALRRRGLAGRAELAFRLETLARVRLGLGDEAGAVTAIDESIRLINGARGAAQVAYLRAARGAILGDADAAARSFAAAAAAGFIDGELLRSGVVLRALSGRPEFEAARALQAKRRGPFAERFDDGWGRPPEIGAIKEKASVRR